MVIRTCLLAQIDRKAPRISTQPLMRSIVSHAEPFQMDLLELSTVESKIHLWEKRKNSKGVRTSLTLLEQYLHIGDFVTVDPELYARSTYLVAFVG